MQKMIKKLVYRERKEYKKKFKVKKRAMTS